MSYHIQLMRFLLFVLLLSISIYAEVTLVVNEFTEQTFTDKAVKDWIITGNYMNQKTSMCENLSLFGGYYVFGYQAAASKTYNSGYDHHKLYISFDLYTIDYWLAQDFQLYVDGILVYTYTASQTSPSKRQIKCGSNLYSDRVHTISVAVPHFKRDFTIKLTSNVNQLSIYESWGIRDLQIIAEYSLLNTVVIAEEFLASNFVASSQGWKLTGTTVGQEFTKCNNNQLFGGFNVFGKDSNAVKTYETPQNHLSLIINFDLWVIDSPSTNDLVQIIVDDQIFSFIRPDQNYGDKEGQLCGIDGYSERIVPVSIQVPHRRSSVDIQIKGMYDEAKTNESFGVQNWRILLYSCSEPSCQLVVDEFNTTTFLNGPLWKNDNNKDLSKSVQTCNLTTYFGPHKENIHKIFTGLPKHTGVRIFFKLLTTGTWIASTKVQILIDDVTAITTVATGFSSSLYCKKSDETIKNYYIDMPHYSDSLTFRIILNGLYIDSAYSIREYSITVYTDTQVSLFTSEFTTNFANPIDWVVSGNNKAIGNLTSLCGRVNLFGGVNSFGYKTNATKIFAGLPEHNFVVVTLNLFFIDFWEQDQFMVRLDDEIVSVNRKQAVWEGNQPLCGNALSKEEAISVRVYFPHTGANMQVTLIDTLDQVQSDESWGVRDIVISTGVLPFKRLKNQKMFEIPTEIMPSLQTLTCLPQSQKSCEEINQCPIIEPLICPPIQIEECPVQIPQVCPPVEQIICPPVIPTPLPQPIPFEPNLIPFEPMPVDPTPPPPLPEPIPVDPTPVPPPEPIPVDPTPVPPPEPIPVDPTPPPPEPIPVDPTPPPPEPIPVDPTPVPPPEPIPVDPTPVPPPEPIPVDPTPPPPEPIPVDPTPVPPPEPIPVDPTPVPPPELIPVDPTPVPQPEPIPVDPTPVPPPEPIPVDPTPTPPPEPIPVDPTPVPPPEPIPVDPTPVPPPEPIPVDPTPPPPEPIPVDPTPPPPEPIPVDPAPVPPPEPIPVDPTPPPPEPIPVDPTPVPPPEPIPVDPTPTPPPEPIPVDPTPVPPPEPIPVDPTPSPPEPIPVDPAPVPPPEPIPVDPTPPPPEPIPVDPTPVPPPEPIPVDPTPVPPPEPIPVDPTPPPPEPIPVDPTPPPPPPEPTPVIPTSTSCSFILSNNQYDGSFYATCQGNVVQQSFQDPTISQTVVSFAISTSSSNKNKSPLLTARLLRTQQYF